MEWETTPNQEISFYFTLKKLECSKVEIHDVKGYFFSRHGLTVLLINMVASIRMVVVNRKPKTGARREEISLSGIQIIASQFKVRMIDPPAKPKAEKHSIPSKPPSLPFNFVKLNVLTFTKH